MTTIVDIPHGPWWRFESYELRDGYICPVQGARLIEYDPWLDYDDALESPGMRGRAGANRAYATPYESLINAVTPASARLRNEVVSYGVDGAADEAGIVDWVNEHGLLGILPHVTQAVVLPIWRDFGAGGVAARRYDRAPNGLWEETPIDPVVREPSTQEELHAWEQSVEGQVLPEPVQRLYQDHWPNYYRPGVYMRAPLRDAEWPLESTKGREVAFAGSAQEAQGMRLVPFRKSWWQFFPEVAEEASDSTIYPMPLSEPFWRSYAEPVSQFVDWARTLESALTIMGSVPGLAWLHTLVNPVTPSVVRRSKDKYERVWLSPSLIGSLAMMALLDQTEGRITRQCDCGRLFVSSAYQAKCCSTKCRLRFQKSHWRHDIAKAVELSGQGLSVSEIAARLETSSKKVQGWIGSKEGRQAAARLRKGESEGSDM